VDLPTLFWLGVFVDQHPGPRPALGAWPLAQLAVQAVSSITAFALSVGRYCALPEESGTTRSPSKPDGFKFLRPLGPPCRVATIPGHCTLPLQLRLGRPRLENRAAQIHLSSLPCIFCHWSVTLCWTSCIGLVEVLNLPMIARFVPAQGVTRMKTFEPLRSARGVESVAGLGIDGRQ